MNGIEIENPQNLVTVTLPQNGLYASTGNRTRVTRLGNEHSTIEPPMRYGKTTIKIDWLSSAGMEPRTLSIENEHSTIEPPMRCKALIKQE
ncbi:hypothetical protein TNCV_3847551 [Trichonephila clavipes]|nr:hypothetical protein TNCV_3847551 [Trichonephila clavipes]